MALAGSLEISLMADVARLRQDMDKASGIVQRGSKAMEDAAGKVRAAFGGIGAGLSVAAFGAWIKGAIDAADSMNDLSKSTDIAVGKLAGLKLAAKQSGSDLEGTAKSINKLQLEIGKDSEKFAKIGITAKDGLGAFKQLADVFTQIKDPQLRAAVAAEALGKSWAGAAPLLSEGSAKIQEMVDKGEALSGMNQEAATAADEFNDRIVELQTALGGTALQIASGMLPILTALAEDLASTAVDVNGLDASFNPLNETLRAVIILGGNVSFVLKGIGTEIGGMAAQVAALGRGDIKGFLAIGDAMKEDAAKARAAFDAWEQKMLAAGTAAKTTAKNAGEASAALTKAQQDALKVFADAEAAKKAAEAMKKAAAEAKKLTDEFEKLRATLDGKELGVDGDFIKTLKLIESEGKKAGMSMADIVRLQGLYIDQQPFMKDQVKQQEEATKRLVDQLEEEARVRAEIDELANDGQKKWAAQLTSARALLEGIEAETAGLRMTNIERETAIALRDLERTGLDKSSDAYKRLAEQIPKAIADREALREGIAMWESIDSTAHDVFTNIFDGGSDVFKRLGRTLKASLLDLLYQMTVKKWIFQIFANVTGGGAGGAVAGAVAQGGTSMVGTAATSMLGTAATSMMGGATLTGTLGGTFGAGLAGGSAAGFAGGMELAGTLFAQGSFAGGMGAALGAIPVVGWIAIAALALWKIFGKDPGGPKQDGKYGTTFTGIGATDNSLAAGVQPVVQGLQTQYDMLARSFGGEAAIQFGMAISRDPKGDANTMLEVAGSRNGAQLFSNLNTTVGRSDEDLTQAFQVGALDALIGALQRSDLSPQFAEYFATIAADASQEAKTAAIQTATAAKGIWESFDLLGPAFTYVTDLSVVATAALVQAAGGMEALKTSLTSYYENFYTEEEKRLNVAKSISRTLAGSGADLSTDAILGMSREDFRGLVEQFAVMGPAGEKAWQALISVNGAFASIIPPAEQLEEVVNAISDAMQRLQAEGANLEIELLRASGDTSGANAMQRGLDIAGLSVAEIALFDRNQGLREQIQALNDASTAAAAAAQQRLGLEGQLLQLQGNTVELRRRELAATDPANRALQQEIWALQDLQAAANEAAQATAAAAAAEKVIADQRYGLETQLLTLQGDTAELRRRELAALDPSNRALQEMIWALQDATGSMQDTARAVEDVAGSLKNDLLAAYGRERSELEQTAAKHRDFARSLRQARDAMWAGSDSPLDPAARTAEARRQFEKQYGGAMAGDLQSIAALQGAGNAYLEALKQSSPTKVEFDLGFARVATGLTLVAARSDSLASAAERELSVMTDQLTVLGLLQTVTEQGFAALLAAYMASTGASTAAAAVVGIAAAAGTGSATAIDYGGDLGAMRQADIDAQTHLRGILGFGGGGWHDGGVRIVGEYGPEIEATGPARYYSNADTAAMLRGGGNDEMLAELRALRQEVAGLRASSDHGNAEIKRGSDVLAGRRPVLVEIAT